LARYGYILLDRHDSDISRQAMQLDTIGGFTRLFIDRDLKTSSGREQRRRLLAQLQSGDIVYTASIDRFCCHLRDFVACMDQIGQAGADLVVLEEVLDTRSQSGRQTLKTLAAFEKLDFTYQSERKKAGIRQARASGRRIGRPPMPIPPGFRDICRDWAEGRISGREAAARSGLKSTSFYKKAAELGFKAPARQKKAPS
jgi:DNA invertase Pin-like site-specific DNA recombinase